MLTATVALLALVAFWPLLLPVIALWAIIAGITE